MINNLAEVYPASDVVEFCRQGRSESEAFNWTAVRLVMNQQPDQSWQLLAIMGDAWST